MLHGDLRDHDDDQVPKLSSAGDNNLEAKDHDAHPRIMTSSSSTPLSSPMLCSTSEMSPKGSTKVSSLPSRFSWSLCSARSRGTAPPSRLGTQPGEQESPDGTLLKIVQVKIKKE